MLELLLHFSMTPMLLFIGYLCWFLTLSKKMSTIYLTYEPKLNFFSFIYRVLLGFLLLGIMNIALLFYLSYSAWVYS